MQVDFVIQLCDYKQYGNSNECKQIFYKKTYNLLKFTVKILMAFTFALCKRSTKTSFLSFILFDAQFLQIACRDFEVVCVVYMDN